MINEYEELISIKNIFFAWQKFSSGKTNKEDIVLFWRNLEENIFNLHCDLASGKYKHGVYDKFIVRDPKERIIHKARVRDRLVHQIIFNHLSPIFEKRFIFDSYASRLGKGTHRAVKRLRLFCAKASNYNSLPCWVLKCDIKKFFDNIDHEILFRFIKKLAANEGILKIIKEILDSFKVLPGKGLPLGNLTSQLFANVYLSEFDHFIKHKLRLKYYIRFNDDFVIIGNDRNFLETQAKIIQKFLNDEMALLLPNEKIALRKLKWGIDFLGYIVLPEGIIIRKKTKKRILDKINKNKNDYLLGKAPLHKINQSIASYIGILSHCFGFKLKQKILNSVFK